MLTLVIVGEAVVGVTVGVVAARWMVGRKPPRRRERELTPLPPALWVRRDGEGE